ncbi:MAG: nitroreductase family protein [Thermodesulfobacteriota bacterium]
MQAERFSGLFEAIYTTRALRRFKPDPVPDEVLFQLFDAAIRAPSGQNAQDWRFVVVTDHAVKRRMQAWAEEGWARYQPRYAENPALMDQLPRTQRLSLKSVAHLVHHLAEAPAIVIVCGLRGRHATPGGSIFPAVQNLLLAARALGLGGSIFNLPLLHRQELMEAVGIPETNEIFCLLPIGYPTDKPGPVRRKPVKKVVFWDRWGQPWPFAEAQPEEGWQAKWVKK